MTVPSGRPRTAMRMYFQQVYIDNRTLVVRDNFYCYFVKYQYKEKSLDSPSVQQFQRP